MTCQQHANKPVPGESKLPLSSCAQIGRVYALSPFEKQKHTTSNSHEQPTLVTAETHLYDTHAWAMYRLFASHRLCD